MKNQIEIIAKRALPALSAGSFTYNAAKNVFLSTGYTSNAGNCYYRALRLSNRLAVFYHIGEGCYHTFLNGISLYAWSKNKAELISQKFWGGCNWRIFTEQTAREESVRMLSNFLAGQAKLTGNNIPEHELLEFSRRMIGEVYQKQIAA